MSLEMHSLERSTPDSNFNYIHANWPMIIQACGGGHSEPMAATLVSMYLKNRTGLSSRPVASLEFERLKKQEAEIRSKIAGYSASSRWSRDELYDRELW